MFKKVILFFNITILLLTTNISYCLSENKNINPVTPETLKSKIHKQNKECSALSTTLMTPISAVGIGVGTILMVPVGLLGGMAGGAMMSPMMFDSGGLSKNSFIQPFQIGGAVILGAVLGAGVGAVELPSVTASSLTQKAKDNCYLI
ncbi:MULTISPECIES: hypothetical protein [unclassified Francisella]|uniref:hypothetical protein n=1 Tax=unclassified Francisella TaxID=2610885 RepID=UPI002E368F35|nr:MULTISPECIES: hypothetical protein [unclassified Francisella]MED7819467.1 hypothetical protein [Francisella sp. 19S2-4]MED7830256.1 hypothetical protein [Francisella sp. 19S2-10]